ncbi:hypothetical protein [Alkaliphilus sp. B6464]|uniref:hypothetical protein n=1 Tax=Alkaliphilus sp. B6464 TaxID=2731219 RepID=UPI001BA822F9|nr:hypothetical protein [Alkaliphilus sp. B6464]QUH21212.1 hypothetical protein HYG84_15855 [Alkaliphilus sp. B6464]
MDKNKQILYCILGSVILASLNSSIFAYSKLGMFPGGYGTSIFGEIIVLLTNILSLAGFVLLAVFSIILIIKNIKLKGK